MVPAPRPTSCPARRPAVLLALLAMIAAVTAAAPVAGVSAATEPDWLVAINEYRSAAGLDPVVEEPAWSAGLSAHLTYLELTPTHLLAGAYASAHTENPVSPYYTPDGAAAGAASNIGGGVDGPDAIDGWMRAPFHAVGILQPNLRRVAFAMRGNRAALDVIRGVDHAAGPSQQPVLFPGAGSTVHLTEFTGELPDPREACAAGDFRGLPIIAMLPQTPDRSTTARVTLPTGTELREAADLCVVTQHNYVTTDAVYGATGRGILTGSRAVFVFARQPLGRGVHTIEITQPSGTIAWSFTVGPPGIAEEGFVHDQPLRLDIGRPGAAVIGNLTVTQPLGPGFLTAWPCEQPRPATSNVNFEAGQTVANAFVALADSSGMLCVYSSTWAHVIVDVTGVQPLPGVQASERLTDTRLQGGRVPAGEVVRIEVGRSDATVIGNLTVTEPAAAGYLTAYPCAAGRPLASTVNHLAGQTVANSTIVRADATGAICVYSLAAAHVIFDLAGLVDLDGLAAPVRTVDTRDTGSAVEPGRPLRIETGQPGAVVVGNLTATSASAAGYLTAYPCSQGRPVVSNVNYLAGQTVANSVVVRADATGAVCVYSLVPVHVIVDLAGRTDLPGVAAPVRVIDTRIQPDAIGRFVPAA